MRALTLFRAMAWFGVVVVFWSLNVRWGTDIDVRGGPPSLWHRTVVGCGLLGFLAALALSVSGRKGAPPAWWARGVAGGASLLMLFLAWRLYQGITTGVNPDAVRGTGFTWMVAGSGMVLSAVIGTLGMKPPEPKNKDHGKGKRRKR